MFATDSNPSLNEVLKVWYLITLLKLSGPDGTQSLNEVMKIIMENFKGGPSEVQNTPYTLLFEFHASLGCLLVPDFDFLSVQGVTS